MAKVRGRRQAKCVYYFLLQSLGEMHNEIAASDQLVDVDYVAR